MLYFVCYLMGLSFVLDLGVFFIYLFIYLISNDMLFIIMDIASPLLVSPPVFGQLASTKTLAITHGLNGPT